MGKKLIGNKNPFFGKTHNEENRKKFYLNKIGKTYEEIYGYDQTIKIKSKKKKNIKIKQNLRQYNIFREYWDDYSYRFKDTKMRFRILKNQNYLCPICFKNISKKFSKNLHHINYVKKDDRRRNLVYLCVSCHTATNYNRDEWKVYLKKINRTVIREHKLHRRYLLKIDKTQSLDFREKLIKRRIHYYGC